mmetsp:Transcript_15771/g.19230  ORF Transcript_15771/g.19230 Transcript_15771/m.19230 type:complete len:772 (+) Transcript_15771:110-2425(+)
MAVETRASKRKNKESALQKPEKPLTHRRSSITRRTTKADPVCTSSQTKSYNQSFKGDVEPTQCPAMETRSSKRKKKESGLQMPNESFKHGHKFPRKAKSDHECTSNQTQTYKENMEDHVEPIKCPAVETRAFKQKKKELAIQIPDDFFQKHGHTNTCKAKSDPECTSNQLHINNKTMKEDFKPTKSPVVEKRADGLDAVKQRPEPTMVDTIASYKYVVNNDESNETKLKTRNDCTSKLIVTANRDEVETSNTGRNSANTISNHESSIVLHSDGRLQHHDQIDQHNNQENCPFVEINGGHWQGFDHGDRFDPASYDAGIGFDGRGCDDSKKSPLSTYNPISAPTSFSPSNGTGSACTNVSYAFLDTESHITFMSITPHTKNEHLRQIYNEQQRRKSKKLVPLALYGIYFKPHFQNHTDTPIPEVYTYTLRKLIKDDPIPEFNKSHILPRNRHTPLPLEIKGHPYIQPDYQALVSTYNSLKLLLKEDCESLESVKVANSYYDYWKPDKVRVILLAESHVFTDEEISSGSSLDQRMLPPDQYNGPISFCSLVYCLGYGEHEAMVCNPSCANMLTKKTNGGTPHFWSLLSACISAPDAPHYGRDLLKSSGLTTQQRLYRKLEILKELKQRGIWLLDTSIIGWYIQQPTGYTITHGKIITKLPQQRPPINLKSPCLRISWEGFMKHKVRDAAVAGNLEALIPIGKTVESILGRDRLIDAVDVQISTNGEKQNITTVFEAFPAPNARLIGGDFYQLCRNISKIVNDATNYNSGGIIE